MCLLTYLPANVQPDTEALRCGAQCNNDGHGFGIVVPGQEEILVGKGMNAEEVIAEFVRLRAQYPHGPALFHSRLTTHGNTGVDNCHPFVVNGDARTVVAHNGILPRDSHPKILGYTVRPSDKDPNVQIRSAVYDQRSDTRILADDLLMERWPTLDSRHTRKRLTRWLGTGNKILVLTTDPRYRKDAYLFNADLGVWTGGIWYSNSSFRPFGRARSGYGSWYDSAWSYKGPAVAGRSGTLADRWEEEWDEYHYGNEYHYGYWYNEERGIWEPPTDEKWRNGSTYGSNDDASLWPVTLGGKREISASKPAPLWVSCDMCDTEEVDPEIGLCAACWTCQDCYEGISKCECYGAPRTGTRCYQTLIHELASHASRTKLRQAITDYRRVTAALQRVDDERAKRLAAETKGLVDTSRTFVAEPNGSVGFLTESGEVVPVKL